MQDLRIFRCIYLDQGVFQVYYTADFGSAIYSSGNAIMLDAEVAC